MANEQNNQQNTDGQDTSSETQVTQPSNQQSDRPVFQGTEIRGNVHGNNTVKK